MPMPPTATTFVNVDPLLDIVLCLLVEPSPIIPKLKPSLPPVQLNEATFIAAVFSAKVTKNLRSTLLAQLGFAQTDPTILHEDNESTIKMVNTNKPIPNDHVTSTSSTLPFKIGAKQAMSSSPMTSVASSTPACVMPSPRVGWLGASFAPHPPSDGPFWFSPVHRSELSCLTQFILFDCSDTFLFNWILFSSALYGYVARTDQGRVC
jgi:hypothetical protein